MGIEVDRTIMRNDPAACVPPLNIKGDLIKAEKVRPIISYTRKQKEFMDYYAKALIANGFAFENARARYCSEALILPKMKKPVYMEKDWRMVVNLNKANASSNVIYWPLPTLEDVQQYLHKARYNILMDLKNGYWQIRLHVYCQELFSFCTHRQVLTSTRVSRNIRFSDVLYIRNCENI